MKNLIFPGEDPVQILDKSYVTNIQLECQTVEKALILIENYTDKDWGFFTISRGGNETLYEGYGLSSVVMDLGETIVIHFILEKASESSLVVGTDQETEEYVEVAKILLGETT